MTAEQPAVQPRDPRQWRPLEAHRTNRAPEITDPIVEPLWQGTRVLAHYAATPDGPHHGSVVLIDADGEDVTEEFANVVAALVDSVYAADAVIDGILTYQALAGGEGVSVVPGANISSMGMLMGRPAEVTVERPPERPHDEGEAEEDAENEEVAFVALDLLSVDGETLFDLPLLERKRQLDGLIAVNEYARISPFARPPVATWFNSWKSAGFHGVVLKAANSRYNAADVARKWAIIERISAR